jgi:hypothetical protein
MSTAVRSVLGDGVQVVQRLGNLSLASSAVALDGTCSTGHRVGI